MDDMKLIKCVCYRLWMCKNIAAAVVVLAKRQIFDLEKQKQRQNKCKIVNDLRMTLAFGQKKKKKIEIQSARLEQIVSYNNFAVRAGSFYRRIYRWMLACITSPVHQCGPVRS